MLNRAKKKRQRQLIIIFLLVLLPVMVGVSYLMIEIEHRLTAKSLSWQQREAEIKLIEQYQETSDQKTHSEYFDGMRGPDGLYHKLND